MLKFVRGGVSGILFAGLLAVGVPAFSPVFAADEADIQAMSERPSELGEAMVSEDVETIKKAAALPFDLVEAMAPRAIGDPNAPIKMAELASLTCGHCAHFHERTFPDIVAKYVDTGKVYLEFYDFPLDKYALQGNVVARCLPKDRYVSFIGLLFKNQQRWAGEEGLAFLKQNAALAGLSGEAFDACVANKDLQTHVAKIRQYFGGRWDIKSTPTFVFNDGEEKLVGAQPLENFEKIINGLLEKHGHPRVPSEEELDDAGLGDPYSDEEE